MAEATEVALAEVSPMYCLMADGAGDPNTAPAFRAAVEALYRHSYWQKNSSSRAFIP
jgi:hypothetical protein